MFNDFHRAGRQDVGARSEDLRKLGPQKAQTLAHSDAALQQEGADLIDNASALADRSTEGIPPSRSPGFRISQAPADWVHAIS
jgi:hypothetical protein